MRPTDFAAATFLALSVIAGPAQAGSAREIVIPAGPLDQAVRALAEQAGIDIGSAEPGLGQVRVGALRMRRSPGDVLSRLLRDTGFEAVRIDDRTFRIVRARARLAAPPAAPRPPRKPLPRRDRPASGEIVVTASKIRTSLLRYPGSAMVLPYSTMADLGARAGPGMSEAAAALPILQTTGQGAGRDKVFVRGVADSSFLGPTQSTATVYFGDVQLGYNGPEPNLSLYDVAQVEVLEGPQGTLYGAGAIGGIIRVEPRAPDLAHADGHVAAGVSLTASGEAGYDTAAMLNLPLARDRLGLRAVAYRAFDGGYIDDVERGRRNVNDTTTTGGRLALRARTDGWTLDAGLVGQRIHAADLQYAQRGLPGLSHAAALAQPFTQRYALGRFVADKQWGDGLHLVLATGVVRHKSYDRFDATRRGPTPTAYDVRDYGKLFTQEARLSRTGKRLRWLGGVSLLRATNRYTRTIGPLDQPRDITGVINRATLAAVFGEATLAVSPRLSLTAGARATEARIDGDPIAGRGTGSFVRGRRSSRVDPTLAASWLIAPSLALYTRMQSGFRTGGIAVAPGVGRVANFDDDRMRVVEAGIRKERSGATGLSGSLALSTTDWDRVQADLVTRGGFPYTANIGSARIRALEAIANWAPRPGLRLNAAVFLNHSRIVDAAPGLAATEGSALPMIPRLSTSAGVEYRWRAGRALWSADLGLRTVGASWLGTQAPLDQRQRGYEGVSAGASVRLRDRWELSLRADNLLNARGDRYASGNSFGLLARDQYTPLRPRTVRLGVSIPLNQREDGNP